MSFALFDGCAKIEERPKAKNDVIAMQNVANYNVDKIRIACFLEMPVIVVCDFFDFERRKIDFPAWSDGRRFYKNKTPQLMSCLFAQDMARLLEVRAFPE